ncbi:UrcA family protein [Sphingomonas sp. NSE70-1]|uniref:UrcA family protein n=1 Tax=Sphingomonas caseinilyticus TaxID=2908205 RepID=A0ABT0RVM1_9SPHN|nr:UrcA family protein [Sphingomonas caseinilyticus]MCL6699078.1 UrcA family protein [Sphingomonas caseinilyticus]
MFARSTRKTSTLVAFALVASASGGASTAVAQQEGQIVVRGVAQGTKMVLVNYRDLNLNFEAHRDVLYGRVGDAVREVCNFDQVRGPGTDYRECTSRSWTGVMPQMYRAFTQHYQRAQVRR